MLIVENRGSSRRLVAVPVVGCGPAMTAGASQHTAPVIDVIHPILLNAETAVRIGERAVEGPVTVRVGGVRFRVGR